MDTMMSDDRYTANQHNLMTALAQVRAALERHVARQQGDPEIQNFGLVRFVHEDVAGLEVTVDHALLMSVLNALAHLHH